MKQLKWIALLGLLGVVLGAFGAHGLKQHLSTELLEAYKTGVLYHFIHVFALFITIFASQLGLINNPKLTLLLFYLGIALFSGSLYLMAFLSAAFGPNYSYLGAITPLGGLAFVAGWGTLFYKFQKNV